MSLRTALFIAYNFPPAGGAGVQRSLKFIKYLPQFGWQPIVITTKPGAYPVRDESLLGDVPAGTPIYCVRGYDINGLRPFFIRLKAQKLLSAVNVALMLPDAALFWARLARSTVRHAIEKYRPSLIFSSSGPASAHLIGLWAKKTSGLPWIADFRDPWSENRLVPFIPGYQAINRRLERRVLTVADRVITISQPLANNLQYLTGRIHPSVPVIENGYDEDDVTALPPHRTDRFTVTYTGTFSRLRRPDAFITSVDRLIASGQIPVEEIRVFIAGKDTAKYIPNRPPFNILGYLNHDALPNLRRKSDLLLFVQDESPENRGAYSGKLFEYLASNRPILAITHPDSVAAILIKRVRAGVVTGHNPSEIAAALLRYYHIWQSGNFNYAPDWDIIRQYTRRNLTARLASEFDSMAL